MSRIAAFFRQTLEESKIAKIGELLKPIQKVKQKNSTSSPRRGQKRKSETADNDEDGRLKIQVVEVVDLEKLKLLHDNIDVLYADFKAKDQQKTLFMNYYDNTMKANGKRVVTYAQLEGRDDFGRLSPQNGVSLQNIRKDVRNTIAAHLYWQLDVSNAHPLILTSIVKHLQWNAPCLKRYVEHRQEVLDELQVPFEKAKRAILIIMYGGNASENIGRPLSPFAKKFRSELIGIAEKIFKVNPGLVKRLGVPRLNSHKQKYSFLAHVLQDYEARCLVAAHNILKERGFHVGALMHDGLLVLRRTDGVTIDESLLSAISEHIDKTEQLQNIRFQLKEMGEGFDLAAVEAKNSQNKIK